MGIQGLDVSYAQGTIDWSLLVQNNIQFAIVKASQGKLLNNPAVGPFTDPQFLTNVKAAKKVQLPIGVYHYLCASNIAEAEKEARYFLKITQPVRNHIALWYAIDVEEDKYLPKDKAELTLIVHRFAQILQSAGCKPLLYTNPNYLVYKLNDVSDIPLWLAYWGVNEASALRYKPVVWQYGIRMINGKQYDGNLGYFKLPEKAIKKGDIVRVLNPIIYGTNRRFVLYYDTYTVLSIQGTRAVIGVNGVITAAIDVKYLERV